MVSFGNKDDSFTPDGHLEHVKNKEIDSPPPCYSEFQTPVTQMPSAKEQKEFLENALKAPLVVGEQMCLMSSEWKWHWDKWIEKQLNKNQFEMEVGEEEQPPPLDNSFILDQEGNLKPDMIDEVDYYLLPLDDWAQLEVYFCCNKRNGMA